MQPTPGRCCLVPLVLGGRWGARAAGLARSAHRSSSIRDKCSAYLQPDRARGRVLMQQLIDSLSTGVPAALTEVITLGRTLKQRAADVLAYFDRPGTSKGPTEAIIIWSPQRRVIDVPHGADRVRQRHVIWSMSLTRTGWIWLSLLAFPRPGRCQRVRRGHVPDATVQVTPRFLARAPDNDQRAPGAPAQLRPRLPQPHQLHRQTPTRDRQDPGPTTPSIAMRQLTRRKSFNRASMARSRWRGSLAAWVSCRSQFTASF